MVERVQGMCVKVNLILPFGSVTFEILNSLDSDFTNRIRVLDMPKLQKKKKKKKAWLNCFYKDLKTQSSDPLSEMSSWRKRI